jgi:type I restriction enzyme R subunit
MSRLTESDIEQHAIELFERLGYHYFHGDQLNRNRPDEVVLTDRLTAAVNRLNPSIPELAKQQAVKDILRIQSPDTLANNETFHRALTEGVKITKTENNQERGDLVWLIDFANPENNDFVVANQFTVIENQQNKRPDLILFVNGLPLVVIELKNPADENATVKAAYQQLDTYKHTISSLFTYNALLVISDGLEAKAGSLSADFSRFMAWKSVDGISEASHLVSQLEILINGMLNKATLLDLVRHFVVFEKSKKEDAQGIISIHTVKKIAAYHQYYAVNKAVLSTLQATAAQGNKKAGVVWHTQGSGKSLSMVFYTGKIVLALDNPTVLMITDRNDLDDQLFDTFAASTQLLRQEPVQADNRDQLKDLLRVASGGVIFSTIQKFQPEQGNVYDELSSRRNIVVIADEAHRTQYGFVKFQDIKDEDGNIAKKAISSAGFAQHLRDALPNATYLGFTGTPIENKDVNTPKIFGNYVDIYDIAQAVEDGATVKINYESRLAKIALSEAGKALIHDLDEELDQDEPSETQQAKSRWTQLEALIGSPQRIKNIAQDIVSHFEDRQAVFTGKGMIVSMSRRIAVDLYNEIIKLKPDWHSNDLNQGVIKVVMTAASSDGHALAKHHTSKQQRKNLAARMKDNDDPLKLVIVRDMWLTGFDAPSLHTLYIDKPMQGHNLMQAIARVNRVYSDKKAGLVVDYLGIAADLKKALSFYSDAGGRGEPVELLEKSVAAMLEKMEVVKAMYHGFDYQAYFNAETREKLSLILAAEEHILSFDNADPKEKKNNGVKRYLVEVHKLSQAFVIAVPHEQAMAIKDELAFFQAVKARLVKFEGTSTGRSSVELETTIKQVIDKALVSEQVVDIFDAAGIKKPDISILSDDFLAEVRGMKHKNIALEVLKKLLADELKNRAKTNLVQSKSLLEMLEASIKKYQNRVLTAAEVIEELIKISKEIVASDDEAKDIGLTAFEYAFYTAVASNDSAKTLMQHDQLRELAVVLTQRVRENASIDWTIKENVRAKLKVIIKRTLRQYGYPPDMQLLATETVLKQAEMIASELANK